MDSTYQGPQSALYPIQSKDMTTPKDGWEWKSVKKYKGMSGVTLYEFTPPNRKKTKVIRHLLSDSKREWQEKLIGEVEKMRRIMANPVPDSDELVGYNVAINDILHILKGEHD